MTKRKEGIYIVIFGLIFSLVTTILFGCNISAMSVFELICDIFALVVSGFGYWKIFGVQK